MSNKLRLWLNNWLQDSALLLSPKILKRGSQDWRCGGIFASVSRDSEELREKWERQEDHSE